MRKVIKKIRKNKENIVCAIKFFLYMTALTMIFKVSPDIADFICKVEIEDMTIFVEWFLCLIFALAILSPMVKNKELDPNNKNESNS